MRKPSWLVKLYNIASKIIGALLFIIIVACIILNVRTYVAMKEGKDLPDLFGYKQVLIAGRSMEPTLKLGDLIIIKETDVIKKGDIVTFKDKSMGAITTHRIHEIKKVGKETLYITKGDANNSIDRYPIKKSQIEGVEAQDLKGFGQAIMFLKSPIGLSLLVGIIIIYILMIIVIRNIIAEEKKEKTGSE